jgi:hypothetical protein
VQVDAETFIYCRGWSGAKPGHADDQNQDAFQIRHDAVGGSVLLAICDGASSTVYARQWARALADAAEPDWPSMDDDALTATLDTVRKRFQHTLPADLPWYMSHKIAKEGSQATLMVASFTQVPGLDEVSIRTIAVGDSSLILFRQDGSTAAFPLEGSADFGLSPRLVSTKLQPGLRYERWDATMLPGDVLVGCTDAVAKWTLESVEVADRSPLFRLLLDVLGDGAGPGLYDCIAGRTQQRRLDEDDVTLVLCVPVRPESARAPLQFAHEVLEGHLTGDFEHLAGAPSAWTILLSSVRRVIRTVRRWIVSVLRTAGWR